MNLRHSSTHVPFLHLQTTRVSSDAGDDDMRHSPGDFLLLTADNLVYALMENRCQTQTTTTTTANKGLVFKCLFVSTTEQTQKTTTLQLLNYNNGRPVEGFVEASQVVFTHKMTC